MTSRSRSLLVIAISISLVLSWITFTAPAAAYAPKQGDAFSYQETQDLANGTGTYSGYTEQTVITGQEHVTGANVGVASASFSYSWTFTNTTTKTSGSKSGDFTFSPTSYLYLNGTDDQTGYVKPTVWFYMNTSSPVGGTFELLNTQMTVVSKNYSYYLPTQNRSVAAIYALGSSSYTRNDAYGLFNAQYTWKAYFDPSTGYIIAYNYFELDSNSGASFDYNENLYVSSTSYGLTGLAGGVPASTATSSPPLFGVGTTVLIGLVVFLLAIPILFGISRAFSRRKTLPKHSAGPVAPPNIDLIPREQPPVQQVVIREVAKVNCKYCGALIDSTATVCPRCGAPRT